MNFERELTGYRTVPTNRGDTLQRVAARELGDASRWVEIANINNLRPPYLTDDPNAESANTKLTGDSLTVPALTKKITADSDPDSVFGRDISMTRAGDMVVNNGDLSLVAGAPNLSQALRHVLQSTPGDLLYHQSYGCSARLLIGQGAGPVNIQIANGFIERCLLEDPRVSRVTDITTTIDADVMRINAKAEAIDGRRVESSI